MLRTSAISGLILATLITSTPVFSQGPVDRQTPWPLARLTGPIQLDGRSDDAAWQVVPPLPLTVHLPTYGSAPTERTVVRVAYDADALYVVIDAFEAHPGGVRASSMVRDDDAPGDFFNVGLDTFGDRQNGITFSTTPGGQRNDWSIANDAQSEDQLSPAWNGVWDLATRHDEDGFHAEFRIPFSTLRFATQDGRVEFGLTVNRLTAHANERITFPAIEPSAPFALWKPSRWQRVTIDNINPGRIARVTPYVLAGVEGHRSPDPVSSSWTQDDRTEVGGDFKLGLGPNVTVDLTANTDFAETEVDDQRINLTRFPLFYPERRVFFIERAGIFDFRTTGGDLLFNSRRVGLTPEGEPVPILGGARVVGRSRHWDFGFFDAQTEKTPASPGENLGVLRVRRDVLNSRSWAGFMVTSRITSASSQAAIGVDGDLHLGGDDYLAFAAVMLTGDGAVGETGGVLPRGALRVRAMRRRNLGLWYRAALATTGARYAPALGYVERVNGILPYAELGYGRVISRPGHQLRLSSTADFAFRNTTGTFESSISTANVALQTPGGATWTLTATRQEDDLLAPFAPTPNTTVPAGRYTAGYVSLTLAPSTGPRAVIGGAARAGTYYDGTLSSLRLSPEWRASAYLRVSADLQVDRVNFPDRNQRAWSRLGRLRVLTSATPQLSLSAVVQTNSLAELATANLRLRYNVREGHDLWIVYGHQANLDPLAPATARAGLMIKYARSFGKG